MGRPLRIEYPDAFYHITARGNERQNIFKSNRDRERFLGYLESASERYKAIIHTYSLLFFIEAFLLFTLAVERFRFSMSYEPFISSLSALDPAFATGIVEKRFYCVKMNSLPLNPN